MTDAAETIRDAAAAIRPLDAEAAAAARARQAQLTKPAGSLGRLEELHVWAAGVRRTPAPALRRGVIIVAAADHGVAANGVSAYPQDVTAQMLANFQRGGAAVNVLAAAAGAEVLVVDAGVIGAGAGERVHVAKTRSGTDDFTRGPAMTRAEAATLVAAGIALARDQCAAGADAIALGDMGIANTTAAAALTSVLAGAPAPATCGRGTGIDDLTFAAKLRVIEAAIAVNRPDPADPLGAVAKVGGFEIALLAGVALGTAAAAVPVLLDGYPTTAAALVAAAIAPQAGAYMLASHLSAEPGHRIALDHLALRPLLELDMRLGEGTGAALALMLLGAALRIPNEMATFEAAGVSRTEHELRA